MLSSTTRFIVSLQYAALLLYSTVSSLASFTNPPGPDGALQLRLGESFTIEWSNAGTSYSELSLGLLATANGNIFWLISNEFGYTSQNYHWTVELGNGITLSQGNVFAFILVNGTTFGEQVLSHKFTIASAAASSSSTSTSSSSTGSSSPQVTSSATSTSSTISTHVTVVLTPTYMVSSFGSSSASFSPATSTTSTSISSTATAPSTSASSLSPTTKAGVAIGCALGAILLFGGLYYLYRHVFPHKPSGASDQQVAENENRDRLVLSTRLVPMTIGSTYQGPGSEESGYSGSGSGSENQARELRGGRLGVAGASDGGIRDKDARETAVHEMEATGRVYEAP